jgi:hypothetical protein
MLADWLAHGKSPSISPPFILIKSSLFNVFTKLPFNKIALTQQPTRFAQIYKCSSVVNYHTLYDNTMFHLH